MQIDDLMTSHNLKHSHFSEILQKLVRIQIRQRIAPIILKNYNAIDRLLYIHIFRQMKKNVIPIVYSIYYTLWKKSEQMRYTL